MRQCLKQDEDAHWYLIPASMADDFDVKCEEANENDDHEDFEDTFGDYRIDGPQNLTFENPEDSEGNELP